MRLRSKLGAVLAVALLAAGVVWAAAGDAFSTSGRHSPVVQELIRDVAANRQLRAELEAALASQEQASWWHGKVLEDLYTFLDEWLRFLPTPEDARLYMDRFEVLANSPGGRVAVRDDLFRQWLTTFMYAQGSFMDSPASARGLRPWLTHPDIDMDDYLVPRGGFSSFNDFFTRRVKPWRRPIARPWQDSILTSPADCYLMPISAHLTASSPITVKGDELGLEELLGGNELAARFVGGTAHLCMLDTVDYHRFHAPVAGEIVAAEELAGLYYGMDGEWVDHFFQHRRAYFIIDTRHHGLLAMVPVGMFTISSIKCIRHIGDRVVKGAELGNFAYGGSAIVLLFEPGRATIEVAPMAHVLMGQRIGTLER